jgi:hypothetical protein
LNIGKKNSIMAKATQVSDVAHGPLVSLITWNLQLPSFAVIGLFYMYLSVYEELWDIDEDLQNCIGSMLWSYFIWSRNDW